MCSTHPTRWGTSAGLLILTLLACSRSAEAQTGAAGLDASRSPVVTGPLPAPGRVSSFARLANEPEVRKRLGLVPEYENFAGIESVKVAVLDYGFDGVGIGRSYLPANTVVVEHYEPDFVRRHDLGDPEYRKTFEPLNRHGRIMAQIIWAVTGSHPGGPQFYLLNASGPTMLRRAVRYAVEQKVDIILFSGSFEGGGNGDGRGPINAIVDEALGSNILWINAAGNYGRRVYNAPVRVLSDGFLRLRNGSDVAALRFRNRLDENSITVTLTWNDYRDQEDAGTDKDLDLYVEDWAGRRVGAGEKRQISGARVPGPDETRNPRERVVLNDLPASPLIATDPDYTYRIRVRAKKGQFTPRDQIRILLTTSHDLYLAPGAGGPIEGGSRVPRRDERGRTLPPRRPSAGADGGRLRPRLRDRPHRRPPGQARRHPRRLAHLLQRRPGLRRLVERRRLRCRCRRPSQGRPANPADAPPAPARPPGARRAATEEPGRHPPGHPDPWAPPLAHPNPGAAG